LSKFRNPSGTRFLKALFFEQNTTGKDQVVYTLKDSDHLGYPSLYRLYMELEDLTEYEFANKYLDGWEHWEMLCKCDWFKPYVERWRKELHLKISARALRKIKAEAQTTSREAVNCAKYLLEKGWVPKEQRGRPSKQEVEKEKKRIIELEGSLDEDFKRIIVN
jgi:hypothetical protein